MFIQRPGFTRAIPDEGMPHVDDTSKKGALVVEFDIDFPKSLTPESKDFIKKALVPNANKKSDDGKSKKKNAQIKSSDFED